MISFEKKFMHHLKSNNFLLFSYLYFLFEFMQIQHIQKHMFVDERADAVGIVCGRRTERNGNKKYLSACDNSEEILLSAN